MVSSLMMRQACKVLVKRCANRALQIHADPELGREGAGRKITNPSTTAVGKNRSIGVGSSLCLQCRSCVIVGQKEGSHGNGEFRVVSGTTRRQGHSAPSLGGFLQIQLNRRTKSLSTECGSKAMFSLIVGSLGRGEMWSV